MNTKIKKIIEGIEGLSEESVKLIVDEFEAAISKSADERVQLAVEEAVSKYDEESEKKVKVYLENVDKDHTNKFQHALKLIDENHTKKLQFIVDKHKQALNEDANNFKEKMVQSVDTFLDLYVEKQVPVTDLKLAVENTHAKNVLDQLRKILAIDPEIITKEQKIQLQKVHSESKKDKEKLNATIKENMELAMELKKIKANILLESKLEGLSTDKALFVKNLLSEKSEEQINNNFDAVCKMYEKKQDEATEKVRNLVNENKDNKNLVDVPKKKVSKKKVVSEGTSKYLEGLRE